MYLILLVFSSLILCAVAGLLARIAYFGIPRQEREKSFPENVWTDPKVTIPNDFGIGRVYQLSARVPLPDDLKAYLGDRDHWDDVAPANAYMQFVFGHLQPEDWTPGVFVRMGSYAWEVAKRTPGAAVLTCQGELIPSIRRS